MHKHRGGQVQAVTFVLLAAIAVAMISASYMWGKPLIEKSQTSSDIVQGQSVMEQIGTAVDEVAAHGGQKSLQLELKGYMVIEGAQEGLSAPGRNFITYTIYTTAASSGSLQWIPLDGTDPIRNEIYTGTDAATLNIDGNPCSEVSMQCPARTADITCDSIGSANGPAGAPFSGDSRYTLGYVYCEGDAADHFVAVIGPDEPVPGIVGADKAGVVVMRTMPYGTGYATVLRLAYRELDDLNSGDGYLTQITEAGNTAAGAGSHRLVVIAGDEFSEPEGARTGGTLIMRPVRVVLE